MKKFNLIAILLLTIAIAVFSACSTSNATVKDTADNKAETKQAKTTEKRGTQLGNIAPEFELNSVKGEKVSFESLKGNPSVLVFWSYYCPVCEEEAPKINKLNAQFKEKGVQVVGINIGESDARVQGGIKDFGIKYTVARDEGSKVTKQFGVIGTPTVIFLDKDGVVKYNGNELPEDYAKRLDSLLG